MRGMSPRRLTFKSAQSVNETGLTTSSRSRMAASSSPPLASTGAFPIRASSALASTHFFASSADFSALSALLSEAAALSSALSAAFSARSVFASVASPAFSARSSATAASGSWAGAELPPQAASAEANANKARALRFLIIFFLSLTRAARRGRGSVLSNAQALDTLVGRRKLVLYERALKARDSRHPTREITRGRV